MEFLKRLLAVLTGKGLKFGLDQALLVLGAKPDITKNDALTGVAFIGALDIPVIVVPETEAKIAELTEFVSSTSAMLETTDKSIAETEAEGKAATKKLCDEAETEAEAISEKTSAKTEAIEEKRDGKIMRLEAKIDAVKTGAENSIYKARVRGHNEAHKVMDKMDSRIAEADKKAVAEIAGLKAQIASLKAMVEGTKAELGILGKIKEIFG